MRERPARAAHRRGAPDGLAAHPRRGPQDPERARLHRRTHPRPRTGRRDHPPFPVPGDPVARLWHSATMLREHRGDGHVAALVCARIGGTEAHVLSALGHGIHPAETFGRIHHLPEERLAAVMAGLRERGLIDADGRFTEAGRATRQRIEDVTDELAAPPYEALSPAELDELVTELEPLTARLVAAGSQ
ncbi:SCO6745 family protein [Streptomyces asoensis]|uniref:SCO6745 family protein n=1 Tax=Streptomyces asoensis TaxID=249586 RepID=UPI003F4D2262